MSKNLRGLMAGLGGLTTHLSHLHTATSIINAFRGSEMPSGSPAVSQGVAGMFGKGDERKLQIIMSRLTNAKKKTLTDFFNWHFRGNSAQDKLLAFWFMGAFRVFATGMKGSNVQISTNKTTTTLPEKDGVKVTSVTDTPTFADEYAPAVEFLEEIDRMIRAGKSRHKKENPTSSDQEQLEAGYADVLAFFKATGVPHMPPKSEKDWGDWAKALGVKTMSEITELYTTGRQIVRTEYERVVEIQQNESRLKSWLRKLIA